MSEALQPGTAPPRILSPRSLPIPWHCQSAANRLIERVLAADKAVAPRISGIVTPLLARARRRPDSPIRKDRIPDLTRDWQKRLEADTRLGLVVDVDPDKRGMLISDCRVTVAGFGFSDWPHTEPGLVLLLVRFRMAPRDFGIDCERLALVSRHALGRRIERGIGADGAAIFADLQRLVIRHDALLTQSPFACRVPSGVWAGHVAALESRPARVLEVRTFLGERELRR